MMNGRWMIGAMAMVGLAGCTHSVHLNHTSDFRLVKPLAEHRLVEVRGEQIVILGIIGNTDYVDVAYASLQEACPNGRVTGIQTRYSTSHNFLSWKNIIDLKGYCSE